MSAAERVLRQGEQRLRNILNSAPVAFVSLDVEGVILDWNAEAELVFGWRRADAVGRKFAETVLPPAIRGAYEHDVLDLLAAENPREFTRHLEATALHQDGRQFPAEVSIFRLDVADSHLFDVFVTDVSSQRQADEDRRHAEERLAHQALHDPLTGLPNRTLLFDRVEHALALAHRHSLLAALLYVGIDDFKLVNDALGHDAGDELLVQFVRRLKAVVRASDTMARFGRDSLARVGGDEVVLLCEALSSEQDAVGIAERIATALRDPFDVAEERVFIRVSTGIALTSTSVTAGALIRDAETAMYRAKERGGDRYEVFDAETRQRLLDRVRQQTELREAIELEQLCVFYQPIVSVVDGGVIGAEALLRWQHPERGLLAAGDFIPLAEQSGLIIPVGRWVLQQAWAQLAQWNAIPGLRMPLRMFVNVSARQLVDDGFVQLVDEVIQQSSMNSSQLILELTESSLINETDERIAVLSALENRGIRLALDDFGTGYSSLAYLKRLPFHFLKLDRSFVSGLGETVTDPQIAAAVIEMARALMMTVIAEGVETQDQLLCLRRLGCHFAQGYYFAEPMPAGDFWALLQRSSNERPSGQSRTLQIEHAAFGTDNSDMEGRIRVEGRMG